MNIGKSFNRLKPCSRVAGILSLVIGAVAFSYGDVIYENDFATRTSKGAVPADPIETFTGIKFRRSPEAIKGISSLCVHAHGTMDNTLDKTVGAFWDNIRIDYTPPGMLLVIR